MRFVPGRSVTAELSATVKTGSDEIRTETFVRVDRTQSSTNNSDRHHRRHRHRRLAAPGDPFLPGLQSVTDPDLASRLLKQLGIDPSGISSRTRSYRPEPRAVIEFRTPRDRVFAKVVRPARVAELQRLHTSLAGQAPIPISLGWSETSGVAMLQALDGYPLRSAIENGANPLPSPESLLDLLATLETPRVRAMRPSLVERAATHAGFLSTILPDTRSACRPSHDPSRRWQTQNSRGPSTATPLVSDPRQRWPNRRTGRHRHRQCGQGTDDLANLLAHLAAVASARPDVAANVKSYGIDLTSTFDSVTDPRQLRLRVSAALLGYAGGPFRVQEAHWRNATEDRIQAAEEWLDAAKATPL